jgi:hypothetical protein
VILDGQNPFLAGMPPLEMGKAQQILIRINLQAEVMRERLEQGKQRETRWQQHAEQLVRDREVLAALYCADRRRQTLAHQVLQTTFESASSELAARLARL